MNRTTEEIQNHIDNNTILKLVLEDSKINFTNAKISILFPPWLKLLNDKSEKKIIEIMTTSAVNSIKSVSPQTNIKHIDIRNIQY